MPVMANEKPSAEHVGREFVRQYYTMLNKDPRQVHRYVNLLEDKTTETNILCKCCMEKCFVLCVALRIWFF